MGIPSIILHNIVNGHAVNLTLDQPIDREITVFFPMVPGKDTITLISDEYLTVKITAEVTNQVNTVVMQKVTDEINNQFATTIMPKIEQSIIDYDQNVTARFDTVNQDIKDMNNDLSNLINTNNNNLTLKLDQEIIDRKEGDRVLEEKIQEIYNIFDTEPNDGIDGTIADMQETMKKLIRIGQDTAAFLQTNPDYDDNSIVLKPLTDFESGRLTNSEIMNRDASGLKSFNSDKETIYENIIKNADYNSNVIISREANLDKIVDKINNDIKTLGVSLTRNVPTGTIIAIPYDGDKDPEINRNYLKCDGKQVKRSVYPELASKLGKGLKESVGLKTSFIHAPFSSVLKPTEYVNNMAISSKYYSNVYNDSREERSMPSNSGILLYLSKPIQWSKSYSGNTVTNTSGKCILEYINGSTARISITKDFSTVVDSWNANLSKGLSVFIFKLDSVVATNMVYFNNDNYPQLDVYKSAEPNGLSLRDVVITFNNSNLFSRIEDEIPSGTRPKPAAVMQSNHPLGSSTFDGLSLNKPTLFLENIKRLYGFLYTDQNNHDVPRNIGKHMFGDLSTWLYYVVQIGIYKDFFLENIFRLNNVKESFRNKDLSKIEFNLDNNLFTLDIVDNNNKITSVLLDNELTFIRVMNKRTNSVNYFMYQKGDDQSDDTKDLIYDMKHHLGSIGDTVRGKLRILGSTDTSHKYTIYGSSTCDIDIIGIDQSFQVCTYDLSIVEEEQKQEPFTLNRLFNRVKEDTGTTVWFKNAFSIDLKQFCNFYSDHYASTNEILETLYVCRNRSTYTTRCSFVYKNKVPGTKFYVIADDVSAQNIIKVKSDINDPLNSLWQLTRTNFNTALNAKAPQDANACWFILNVTNLTSGENVIERLCYLPFYPSQVSLPLDKLQKDIQSFYTDGRAGDYYIFTGTFEDTATYNISIHPLVYVNTNDIKRYMPGTYPEPLNPGNHTDYKNLKGPIYYHMSRFGYHNGNTTEGLSNIIFEKIEDYKKVFYNDITTNISFDELKDNYIGKKNLGLLYTTSGPMKPNGEKITGFRYEVGRSSGTKGKYRFLLYLETNNYLEYWLDSPSYNITPVKIENNYEGQLLIIRTRVMDSDTKEVIINDYELPIIVNVLDIQSNIRPYTELRIPGAKGADLRDYYDYYITKDIGVRNLEIENIILTTLCLERDYKGETFKIPDLRDDFLRFEEGSLGVKRPWSIPNIMGGFKIMGNNGGFDSFSGVFRGNGGNSAFPRDWAGSGSQTLVMDLNNLPKYSGHVNTVGKFHPDYTGVQYWIKF